METNLRAASLNASLNINNASLYEIEVYKVMDSLGYNRVFIMVIGQSDFSSRQSAIERTGMFPCGGNHDRHRSDGALSPSSHPA
jgi:hypothetical protein